MKPETIVFIVGLLVVAPSIWTIFAALFHKLKGEPFNRYPQWGIFDMESCTFMGNEFGPFRYKEKEFASIGAKICKRMFAGDSKFIQRFIVREIPETEFVHKDSLTSTITGQQALDQLIAAGKKTEPSGMRICRIGVNKP